MGRLSVCVTGVVALLALAALASAQDGEFGDFAGIEGAGEDRLAAHHIDKRSSGGRSEGRYRRPRFRFRATRRRFQGPGTRFVGSGRGFIGSPRSIGFPGFFGGGRGPFRFQNRFQAPFGQRRSTRLNRVNVNVVNDQRARGSRVWVNSQERRNHFVNDRRWLGFRGR